MTFHLQDALEQVEQEAKVAAAQNKPYYYTEIPEQAHYDYDAVSALIFHQFMEIEPDGDVRIRPVSDYAQGTAALVLSSRHGRRKDIIARLLFCMGILLVIFVSAHALLLVMNMLKFGVSGGEVSAALATVKIR